MTRHSKTILSVLLLWNFAVPSNGAPPAGPAKNATFSLPVAGNVPPPAIKASLIEERTNRGQVAACANLAALRGVSARTSGADYATQNRVLELTFLLCMSGSPTRD